MAERAEALESACRTAMEIVASSPDGRARLARPDPLPASTVRILHRLIAETHAREALDRG
jgi:hypothetical protein